MRNLVIGLIIFFSQMGCTPGAVKWEFLSPVRNSTTLVADELYANEESADKQSMPPNADKVVTVGDDSLLAALSLYEFDDIFWLDVYVLNNTGQSAFIGPSRFALLDRARLIFRQLLPHEAANIYTAKVTAVPPYQPKYTYDLESSTQGYANIYGNTAYYNETTKGTVTAREDPFYKLGYSIGAAIVANSNKKMLGMASAVYSVGLIDGTEIPSTAAMRGGIFWLKRKEWAGPLTLRFIDSGYEVQFDRQNQ